MAESLTMTRGQLHDLLAGFAVENPKYREALINDPKMVLEKQLGSSLGNVQVKSVVETPDAMYVVVPYVQKDGELSDADLENVAGGMLNNLLAKCEISGGSTSCRATSISSWADLVPVRVRSGSDPASGPVLARLQKAATRRYTARGFFCVRIATRRRAVIRARR